MTPETETQTKSFKNLNAEENIKNSLDSEKSQQRHYGKQT